MTNELALRAMMIIADQTDGEIRELFTTSAGSRVLAALGRGQDRELRKAMAQVARNFDQIVSSRSLDEESLYQHLAIASDALKAAILADELEDR